jgi:hypothetical protein
MTFSSIIAAVLTFSSSPYSLKGDLELIERVSLPTIQANASQPAEEQPAILETIASIAQPEVRLSDINSTYFSRDFDPCISLNVRRDDLGGFEGTIQVTFAL